MGADDDKRWMRRCLALARRAWGRTSPNPMVGCVIVKHGRAIAEGWHRRQGAPHAEVDALAKLPAGAARGATLYCNLEPCSHRGFTPPCAPRVAASGVARVVTGMRDPFLGHGGGAQQLRAAGLRVDEGVLEEECERLNEVFVVVATARRAHFTLKAAITLDGRIATRAGESRWITGEAARHDAHRRRDRADAILVGAGTVASDDPLLTVRDVPRGRDPVRVVLDGRLSMSPRARMLSSRSPAATIVATTQDAPGRRADALARAGAEVWRLPGRNGRVDLRALARALAARKLCSVLVEGGAEVHAGFLGAGLCDRLVLHVAPVAFGGAAPAWLGGAGVAKISAAPRFTFDLPPRRLGDDLVVELVPRTE